MGEGRGCGEERGMRGDRNRLKYREGREGVEGRNEERRKERGGQRRRAKKTHTRKTHQPYTYTAIACLTSVFCFSSSSENQVT